MSSDPIDYPAHGAFDATDPATLPPLPTDRYPDIFGYWEQRERYMLLAMRFALPALAIGFLVALAWGFLGWKQQARVYVHEVFVQCAANEHITSAGCSDEHVALDQLIPMSRDLEAQSLLARAMLPVFVHSAFTIDSPSTNEYNWAHFVLPYLLSGAQATRYFSRYIDKTVPKQVTLGQHVAIRVDRIPAPAQPGVYLVGWLAKISNGYTTTFQHNIATITVVYGKRTRANLWGIYVSSIAINHEAAQAASLSEWNSDAP